MESIRQHVIEKLKKWPQWRQAKSLLIGVSGGVDSMVLFDILSSINQELDQPKQIYVAHFNHQLRETSQADADLVQKIVQAKGYPYFIKKWQNPSKRNLEAAGRDARYQFFADIVANEGIDLLFTGHHLNDLAETMVMRLTRGTSLRGLRGIRANYRRTLTTSQGQPVQVQLIRPLLSLSKESLYAYAKEKGIAFLEDETNSDMTFFRNRIRNEIMPIFISENGQFLENMNNLHNQLLNSYDVHFNQYMAEEGEFLTNTRDGSWVLFAPAFIQMNDAKRNLFLTIFCEERLVEVVPAYSKSVIDRMESLILSERQPNASFSLNELWRVRRAYDYVYIEKIEEEGESLPTSVDLRLLNHWHPLSEFEEAGIFDERYFTTAQVQAMDYYERLYIRPDDLKGMYWRHRKAGDWLELVNGATGEIYHKKVSRYLIDKKVPANDREAIWLLLDSNGKIVSLLEHLATSLYRYRDPLANTYYLLYRKKGEGESFRTFQTEIKEK